MKIELELKPLHILIGLLVLFFVTVSFMQYSRTKGLRKEIKENKELVKQLKDENVELLQFKKVLDEEKYFLIQKLDSLEIKERYYKNKYFITNEKLKKTLDDYNSASSDRRNELFTNAINN